MGFHSKMASPSLECVVRGTNCSEAEEQRMDFEGVLLPCYSNYLGGTNWGSMRNNQSFLRIYF